ncbi:uncharacterized protein MKK02DRAFT_30317 [Dioszegia hungarica]|uniref:Uncharacterized protein n=1 Tax=Dioszegia hungarica TaxID=4972 RepID=A0AA38H2B1_9TREE|nr:uncharacterized protein MKK02DRAFT_30317 [Dioszegia hungarica]KAI9632525.1 hypothetical protein MKK02DRAFT_30317 [Dioszegia hungarica]
MPTAPKRQAAARAARNILQQYTTPFAPINQKLYASKLGNTATRYEREDRAFRPGSYLHRSYAAEGPEAFGKPDEAGHLEIFRPGSTVGLEAEPSNIKAERRARMHERVAREIMEEEVPDESFMDYYAGAGAELPGPQAGPSQKPRSASSGPGKFTTTNQPPKRSHKRKLPAAAPPPPTPPTRPTSPPHMKYPISGFSSPLTPRDSDDDDLNSRDEAEPLFLSAPTSPEPVQAQAQAPRMPLASPPSYIPPMPLLWWADLGLEPQPSSSPLIDPATLRDEPITKSGRSGHAAHPSVAGPSRPYIPNPDSRESGEVHFKPRREALHAITSALGTQDVKPKSDPSGQRKDMLEEVKGTWGEVKMAFGRMERVMSKLETYSLTFTLTPSICPAYIDPQLSIMAPLRLTRLARSIIDDIGNTGKDLTDKAGGAADKAKELGDVHFPRLGQAQDALATYNKLKDQVTGVSFTEICGTERRAGEGVLAETLSVLPVVSRPQAAHLLHSRLYRRHHPNVPSPMRLPVAQMLDEQLLLLHQRRPLVWPKSDR